MGRSWVAWSCVIVGCRLSTSPLESKATSSPQVEVRHPLVVAGSPNGSTIALVHIDGALVAYVADADEKALRVIDVETSKIISSFDLRDTPGPIVTLPNARVAVTLRTQSKVVVLEGAGTDAWPLARIAEVKVSTEPRGIARTPDDANLLVASGWGHALTVLDARTLELRATHDLGREPRGVIASEDGHRAFVTHAVGPTLSVIDLVQGGAPKVIPLGAESQLAFRQAGTISFPRHPMQGYALALSQNPAGRLFVPHALSHTSLRDPWAIIGMGEKKEIEADVSDGYGMTRAGSNAVGEIAVVDADRAVPIDIETKVGFIDGTDEPRVGRVAPTTEDCVLPRDAVISGRMLYVACYDDGVVVERDGAFFHPELVRKWPVPKGPLGLAVDKGRILVWSEIGRTVSVLGTAGEGALVIGSVPIPAEHPLPADIQRGRELFMTHDKRISGDGRVCASCHPDGREDGLSWPTPEGRRQTPMIAGRLDGTAPYGWTGSAADLSTHLTKTFERLKGKGMTGADKDALATYVRSIAPPPPLPKDDALVLRGRVLFHSKEAECSTCHGVDGDVPDGARHNVMSWSKGDAKGIFDTPSLKFIGGTAPYYHDGRYRTLGDLLKSVDGTMGHTKQWNALDREALEAYLRSL